MDYMKSFNVSSANNTDEESESLHHLSLQVLGSRLWANGVIICFGIAAMISNTVLITVIGKSKSLHTKCFILMGVSGIIDLILGLTYAFTNVKRIYRYVQGIGEVMTRWECFEEISLNAFVHLLSLAMTASLVADRSVALLRPVLYHKLTFYNLTLPLLFCVLLYSTIQLLVNLYDSFNATVELTVFGCGIDDSVSDQMQLVLMSIQVVTSIGVVMMNCVLALVVKYSKKNNLAWASANDDRERKILKAITLTVLIHLFVYLGGRVCILVAPLLFDALTVSLTNRYVRDLVVISAAANLFVIYFTSSEFRGAAKKMFKVTNSVGPACNAGQKRP